MCAHGALELTSVLEPRLASERDAAAGRLTRQVSGRLECSRQNWEPHVRVAQRRHCAGRPEVRYCLKRRREYVSPDVRPLSCFGARGIRELP